MLKLFIYEAFNLTPIKTFFIPYSNLSYLLSKSGDGVTAFLLDGKVLDADSYEFINLDKDEV